MKFLKHITAVAVTLCLVACGGGSSDLPPLSANSSALAGTVTGSVVMSSGVKDAKVSIYEYDNGIKGKQLATTTTQPDGSFLTTLRSLTRPILIESLGGEYREVSSGKVVTIKDSQPLQAVAYYDEGTDLSSPTISPLSHLSKALLEFRLKQNNRLPESLDSANADINGLFDLNIAHLLPADISLLSSDNATEKQKFLGFLLASLSSLSKAISEKNGVSAHTSYNSIALTQVLYNDLASDGKLNGLGFNSANDQLVQLSLGMYTLNTQTYRIDLPQHLLSMAIHAENKTSLNVNDLLPYAIGLTNRESTILAQIGSVVSDVILYNLTPAGMFHNDTFEFSVLVSKPELVQSIVFDLNGQFLASLSSAANLTAPKIQINTLNYDDGDYTLGVTVNDLLGNKIVKHYAVRFDNTSPFINVLSDTVTNQASIALNGDFGDNGSGVRAIKVQGNETTLGEDNTWHVNIPLNVGLNVVPITLLDWAGNEFIFQTKLIRDESAPNITLLPEQSFVQFSDSAGGFTNGVVNQNNLTPLYIATNRTDLGSIALNKNSLNNKKISYLSLRIDDPAIIGENDYNSSITVNVKYLKNATELSDNKKVTSIAGQYLIPIVSEFLGSSWLSAIPSDENMLLISAQDQAGNISTFEITFNIDFVVADLAVNVTDEIESVIKNVSFTNRGSLYDKKYKAVSYKLKNESSNAYYISTQSHGTNQATQLIEHMQRKHIARLETDTLWRVGSIINIVSLCANSQPSLAYVTDVNTIYDFDGQAFVARNRPQKLLGPAMSVQADTAPEIQGSTWTPVAPLNNFYKKQVNIIGDVELTYEYDYIINNTFDSQQQPAAIRNWKRTYIDGTVETCGDINFFAEKKSYKYISEPSYPKNELSNETIDQTIENVTFQIYNETLGQDITANNGWYRVPEGHTITITKNIVLPSFTVYNHTDVATPATFSSYTVRSYDKSISWNLDNDVTLTAIHDAGAGSLLSMTPSEFSINLPNYTYRLSR